MNASGREEAVSSNKVIIIESAILIFTWIFLGYNETNIMNFYFNTFRLNVFTNFIISNTNISIYLVLFIMILIVFFIFHKKENLLCVKKVDRMDLAAVGVVFCIYIILMIISIKISEVQYDYSYLIFTIISNFVLIALVEEVSFRRMILQRLFDAFNKKSISIAINVVIFLFVHIVVYVFPFESFTSINKEILIIRIIYLIVMSSVLGLVYSYFNNILPCIVIHGGQNILDEVIYMDSVSGIIIYLIGLIIACLTFSYIYYKKCK